MDFIRRVVGTPSPEMPEMKLYVQAAVLDRRHNTYIAALAENRTDFLAMLAEAIQSQNQTQITLLGEPMEYDGQSVVFLDTLTDASKTSPNRRQR